MAVDPTRLRDVMRRVPQPVVVVTVRSGTEVRGMTAASFTSVALAPPLVSVDVKTGARTHRLITESGAFTVNILAHDQGHLAERFARPELEGPAQFDGVPHSMPGGGPPLIGGAVGYLACHVAAAYAGGDHTIFLGEVTSAETGRDTLPLIFVARDYHTTGSRVPGRGQG
jgi:3-hydroxy-9,10-secoandrosta-1,3,5(10)-triene-9,17-dione monooxygenase reductase component